MSSKNTSPRHQLEALESELAADFLAPELSIEVVREQLRAAGGDPEQIRYEAAVFVEEALKQHDSRPTAERQRRGSGSSLGRMTKEQLVRHANALRSNPAAERALRAKLSASQAEAISEDELRELLEEFQSLFDEDVGGDDDGTK